MLQLERPINATTGYGIGLMNAPSMQDWPGFLLISNILSGLFLDGVIGHGVG